MNYLWDDEFHLSRRINADDFAYSDGIEVEDRLLDIVSKANDRGTFSLELAASITDWPTEYHLSRFRHCLLRPLGIRAGDKVLELGCGCGAITRFLGEVGADVVAVDGSFARAKVAAARCRDLTNVRVVVDDLLHFETEEKFDYVLLIGVLEYAAMFSRQDNPFRDYLHSVSRFLASGGKVVVAIENKLGLKYFNGCEEDHLGIPFFGVQDLYGSRSPRTFGKHELAQQLSGAGLPHVRFFYPFPDYKLPSVVLSEDALSDQGFDPIDLLSRCQARDYRGFRYRSFDEALTFSALHKNRLLADLSNSFLLVATADSQAPANTNELAFAFSVERAPQFCTQTRFLRSGSEIRVFKERIASPVTNQSAIPVSVGNMSITNQLIEAEYRPGRQLLWALLEARARNGDLDAIVQALYPWMEFLVRHARGAGSLGLADSAKSADLSSYLLPGDFLDCTPFNLLDSGSEAFAIDMEWQADGDISLGWVVTRGVLWSLSVGMPADNQLQSVNEVIEALSRRFGLSVSPAEINHWLELEADFQALAVGRPRASLANPATSNGLQSFFTGLAHLQQTAVELNEHIGNLNQGIAESREQISRLETEHERQAAAMTALAHERDQLQSELAGVNSDLASAREELSNRSRQLSGILHSRTWKLTSPLRKLANLHPRRYRRRRQFQKDTELLTQSTLFDAAWYLSNNPDVAKSGEDPVVHYLQYGGREGRDPSENFSSTRYLEENADVRKAGMNPLVHYLRHGAREGRRAIPASGEVPPKDSPESRGSEFRAPRGSKLKALIATQRMRWRGLRQALRGDDEEEKYKVVRFVALRLPLPDAGRQFVLRWGLDRLVEKQHQAVRARLRSAQDDWDAKGKERLQQLLSGTEFINCPTVASPQVSFILVLRNKAHLSLLTIESILRFADVSYELIIVDNGSDDDTSAMLDRIRGARILRNPTNAGFGPACMQAAALATGEYLCFFNNDALLSEGAVSSALKPFEDPNVGAVGGKILLANGSLQEAGSIIWSDGSALGYGRGDDPELPQYNFRRPVDYCSGVFLITPKRTFERLGGFSSDFAPAYYEDTDYCMTLWHNGLSVIYEPLAKILHYESASSGGNEFATAMMASHQIKFRGKWQDELKRHYPPDLAHVLAARIAVKSSNLRILYIDDRIPHRTLGSGFPRSNDILKELVRLGHSVVCSTFTFPLLGDGYDDIPREMELFDGLRFRRKLVEEYMPWVDVVWLSRPHNLKLLLTEYPALLTSRKFALVYDAEAIFSQRVRARTLVLGEEGASHEPLEPASLEEEFALAKAADCVTVVSEADRNAMLEAGVRAAHVVGHRMSIMPTETPFAQRDTFLFVGSVHGRDNPNSDSIRYFYNAAWPEVRRATGAALVIAGYGTEALRDEISDPTVRILGAQDDLRPLYEAARVFVVPTRFAAGLPFKAHEAAAFGVPLVVSDLIARQMQWTEGSDYFATGNPDEFARYCCMLYSDEALWNRVRNNALARVREELSSEAFAANIKSVLAEIMSLQMDLPVEVE